MITHQCRRDSGKFIVQILRRNAKLFFENLAGVLKDKGKDKVSFKKRKAKSLKSSSSSGNSGAQEDDAVNDSLADLASPARLLTVRAVRNVVGPPWHCEASLTERSLAAGCQRASRQAFRSPLPARDGRARIGPAPTLDYSRAQQVKFDGRIKRVQFSDTLVQGPGKE